MKQVAVGDQLWSYESILGRGTPILILHGWGRNAREWGEIARQLAKQSGRGVYVIDLPGFGGSSIPRSSTIQEFSQSVCDFCRYLDIKKVILIGHSLGGRVGIVLGALQPSLIERLILIDPAGVKPKSLRREFLKIMAKLFGWLPVWFRHRVINHVMDEDFRNSPALRNLYRVVVAKDLRNYLSKIQCQTIVVWGENDPVLPLSQAKLYRQLLPDSQIKVIWGAGHDPHLEKFDQTLTVLQEAVE